MSLEERNPTFERYLDYVKALGRQSPHYRELQAGLENSKSSQLGRIQIQDIRSDGSYCSTAIFTHHESNVAERLKDALSDCTTDVRTRLVLIEYRSSKNFDPFYGAEEAIPLSNGLWCEVGLKLDIEPLFFEASWNKGQILRLRQYPHQPHSFLRMIYMTLKLLPNCPVANGSVSTAIVAFNSARKIEGNQILYMINPAPSLQDFQASEVPSKGSKSRGQFVETIEYDRLSNGKDAGDVFLGLLRAEQTASSEDDLFRCINIMARIESMFFRASMSKFFSLWTKMTIEPSEQMAIKFRGTWRPCRRRLDNFKDSLRAFERYAKHNFGGVDYKERLADMLDDQRDALQEGQAIEAMLKDDMQFSVGNVQVEVGKAVLEESRRSIVEGKRVQLITILAFVFIPLSLAASIYGMNVQEINNTGGSIWEFILTSVILVLLALGGWLVTHIILKRKGKSSDGH